MIGVAEAAALALLAGMAGAETNGWTVAATDQRARFWSGAVWDATSKGVHVWGGLASGNDVELFDPDKGIWTRQYEPDPGGQINQQWHYITGLGWTKTGRPAMHCFVWNQLAYDESRRKVFYFMGGQTIAYHVTAKTWERLAPSNSPPPVSWGSLAYDPVNREILLFGGGGIYEGYTGMWAYAPEANNWSPLKLEVLPPPRCCSQLAVDAKNKVLVVFGGDAQDRLLDDTWLFDLEKRQWRQSRAALHPSARGGHGLAWEPNSGLAILAGGYTGIQRGDNGGKRSGWSREVWAYDAAADRWRRLAANAPDLWEKWNDQSETLAAFPGGVVLINNQVEYEKAKVRKTAMLRLEPGKIEFMDDTAAAAAQPKPAAPVYYGNKPPEVPEAHRARAEERLKSLPANTWVPANPLAETEYNAFGCMRFDLAGDRAVYWGGGHATHQLNHLAFYDLDLNTWWACYPPESMPPPFQPENGCRGMTFAHRPWNVHTGKRYYAWDSADKVMVYSGDQWQATPPAGMFQVPWQADGITGCRREVMGFIDPETARYTEVDVPRGGGWLVETPGHILTLWPRDKSGAAWDLGIFLPREGRWDRKPVTGEFASGVLVFDSTRKLLLSCAGDKVWELDPATGSAAVRSAAGILPRNKYATGEAYIPKHKTVLISGTFAEGGAQVWAYSAEKNKWSKVDVKGGANIACDHGGPLVYSPKHDVLISMSNGRTYLMRYQP
jgi:hypothetical protein